MARQSAEEKKNSIAENAIRVFGEKGYWPSSLQDIAVRMNISKAGLYHYFKSKEEILAYIILSSTDLFLSELKSCIKKSAAEGISPQEAFEKLVQVYAQLLNMDKDIRLIILRERHQLSEENKARLLKKEREMFLTLRDEMEKIEGLKKDMDRNVVTFLLVSMCHWLGYWYKSEGELSLPDIIDQNLSVVFNGILD